ncbi:thioredoxin reductase (NADPH) [Myroides gitamensis]|uniref:thioredoxin-disulfide reductase n=1 Tax=Myroides odoratus TaxID=256 RepID=UPI002168A56F|nr:thioredoxin-disulfide reductase [Myroides odoratus]MCS4238695.1 thioredoxin reductase (NADPH) [Myroides odoratus]MDH6600370.1 thioredoxin reductase (NADPH) [Myroides gitamensis]
MMDNKDIEHVSCLIIGSGPAGYTAAIYAARANLNPVLYTGMEPGGQLTTTTEVDNFPGYPKGVNGPMMMDDLKEQAERFNADIRYGIVSQVNLAIRPFQVEIDGTKSIIADTIIIATGASAKWLGLPSEKTYNGYGVSACAVCDGFFYKNQDVIVVGGGDTAVEEASYLAKLCKKVYVLVRRDELRASKVMQHRINSLNNVEILYHTELKEIIGKDNAVTGALVQSNSTSEEFILDVQGVFIAIGHQPNTKIFEGIINLDENGYIKTIPGTARTNIAGVFACGDVQDSIYRQAITAAGTGCMAALDAERFLAFVEE